MPAPTEPVFYESHAHTPLCKHATGTPVDYAEQAAALKGQIEGVLTAVGNVLGPIAQAVTSFVSWKDVLVVLGIAIASVVIPVLWGIIQVVAPIVAVFAGLVLAVALVRNAFETNFLGIQTLALNLWSALQGVFEGIRALLSGDTTAGGLSRTDWALVPETDALIVTLGGNDLLRGIDPAASRGNLDGILKEADARGLPVLLVAMKAPRNYGPEYKAEFDAMYGALAASHGALLAEDFFAGLRAAGADPSDPASLTAFMQADGLHPNPEGVRLIVEGLGPKVEELLAKVQAGAGKNP